MVSFFTLDVLPDILELLKMFEVPISQLNKALTINEMMFDGSYIYR